MYPTFSLSFFHFPIPRGTCFRPYSILLIIIKKKKKKKNTYTKTNTKPIAGFHKTVGHETFFFIIISLQKKKKKKTAYEEDELHTKLILFMLGLTPITILHKKKKKKTTHTQQPHPQAGFFFSTLPPVFSSCLRPGRPLPVLPPCFPLHWA
ncbi:hypothetical protein CsSME_00009456 [Camellia sinensis var. sinensis]